MSETPASRTGPELRASDAERERAAETLRRAAGEGRISFEELDGRLSALYASRTRGELAALTADLPTEQPTDPSAPVGWGVVPARPGTEWRAQPGPTVRPDAGRGTELVLSILGSHERAGRWRLARRCKVLNVLGDSRLDLSEVELCAPETEITMISVLGEGEIRVPHGVQVTVSQIGILGANEIRLGDEQPSPGAPLLRLRLVSVLGEARVRRHGDWASAAPGRRRRRRIDLRL